MGKNNFFKITSSAFVLAGALSVGYYHTSDVYGGGDFASEDIKTVVENLESIKKECAAVKDVHFNVKENADKKIEIEGSCTTCEMKGTMSYSPTAQELVMLKDSSASIKCNTVRALFASSSEIKEQTAKPKSDTEPALNEESTSDEFNGNITSEPLKRASKKCLTKKSEKEQFECFKTVITDFKSNKKGNATSSELEYLFKTYIGGYAVEQMKAAQDAESLSEAKDLYSEVQEFSQETRVKSNDFKKDFSAASKESLKVVVKEQLNQFDAESENLTSVLEDVKESLDGFNKIINEKDMTKLKSAIVNPIAEVYTDYLKSSKENYVQEAKQYQMQNQEYASDGWVNQYELYSSYKDFNNLKNQGNAMYNDLTSSTNVLKSLDLLSPSSLSSYFENQFKQNMMKVNAAIAADPYGQIYSLDNLSTVSSFNINNSGQVFNPAFSVNGNGNFNNNGNLNNFGNNNMNNNNFVPGQQTPGITPLNSNGSTRFAIGQSIGGNQNLNMNTTGLRQRQGNMTNRRSTNLGNYGSSLATLNSRSKNVIRGIL